MELICPLSHQTESGFTKRRTEQERGKARQTDRQSNGEQKVHILSKEKAMESKTYLFLTEERQSDKEPNASLSGGQSNKVSAKTERAILQRAKCFIFSFKTEQRRAKYPTFFFFKDRTKTVNKKSVSSPKADKQQRAERPTFSLKPDRAIFSSVPRPIGSSVGH